RPHVCLKELRRRRINGSGRLTRAGGRRLLISRKADHSGTKTYQYPTDYTQSNRTSQPHHRSCSLLTCLITTPCFVRSCHFLAHWTRPDDPTEHYATGRADASCRGSFSLSRRGYPDSVGVGNHDRQRGTGRRGLPPLWRTGPYDA